MCIRDRPSVAPTPSPTPEAVLWRDDIVTDGNLLDYDLQVTMQACCEEYGVPYALSLIHILSGP